jgi:fucose permease
MIYAAILVVLSAVALLIYLWVANRPFTNKELDALLEKHTGFQVSMLCESREGVRWGIKLVVYFLYVGVVVTAGGYLVHVVSK